MKSINEYSVGPNGTLWVKTDDGKVRKATDKEWLRIWQTDPRVTLRLAH